MISINSLYKEVRWESLAVRRNKHKLCLFYKMPNNLTPSYFSSLFPVSVGNASKYILRNSNDLQTIDARMSLYYNSFLPSSIRAWNNLPTEAKKSESLNSFKHFLNSVKEPVPEYYYSSNRKSQILHIRLITNCSALNLDHFSKNLNDLPLCRCGSIEDVQHFFFHCRRAR